MSPSTLAPRRSAPSGPVTDSPARRPLLVFAVTAVPTAWVLLGLPVALGLPLAPFVVVALLLALVLPALVLTGRQGGRAAVRALLRDAVRVPRPLGWGLLAVAALPALVWTAGAALGSARPLTGALLGDVAVTLLSGAAVINIWEEMAWAGFFQRRATARWGLVRGVGVTALLFAGVHLPLAFDGARTAGDVLAGAGVLVATGIGLRFVVAGLDRWSGRSLLAVGLLHASFNASADLLVPGADAVRLVLTVLVGLVVLAVLLRGHGRVGHSGARAGR
jgi:membrane protease YdiL (CAAX protease family)